MAVLDKLCLKLKYISQRYLVMATTYHLLPKNTPRNTLDPLLETLKFLNSLNQQVYGR